MTIKFLLLVNKQGQTRLAKYFTEHLSIEEKRALEAEIVRKCLSRTDKQVCLHAFCGRAAAVGSKCSCSSACGMRAVPWRSWRRQRSNSRAAAHAVNPPPHPSKQLTQCSFFEHRAYKIVYRRYASLFFMVGVDSEEVRIGRCAAHSWRKGGACAAVPNHTVLCLLTVFYSSGTLNSRAPGPGPAPPLPIHRTSWRCWSSYTASWRSSTSTLGRCVRVQLRRSADGYSAP